MEDEVYNPNGAIKNIAGIFNKNKNVLGMMPHPERMIDKYLSGEDGSLFFENLLRKHDIGGKENSNRTWFKER